MLQGPGLRVVSREIVEELDRAFVFEASQAGSVIGVDEVADVGVSLFVVVEAVFASVAAVGRFGVKVILEASVEALDHAVGLGPEGPGEAMPD